MVGDGFAGLAAARYLAGKALELVFCGSGSALFLPLLPDLVSGRLGEEALLHDYRGEFAGKSNVRLAPARVTALDPAGRTVRFADGSLLEWDYCILASGAEPAFSLPGTLLFTGLEGARRAAALPPGEVTVVGGGYTGVELAGAFARRGLAVRLVEAGPMILGGLPERVRHRVEQALGKSGVEIVTGMQLENRSGGLFLGAERLDPPRVVVAAGVRGASGFLPAGLVDTKSGRLPVNPALQAAPSLYAAGDLAGFEWRGRFLRPSVNFALTQGRRAARNVWRECRGKSPRPYRRSDPGYLVPVYSRGRAWGSAFGCPLGGRIGLFAHYAVCVLRAFSLRQALRVLRQLCGGGRAPLQDRER